MKSSRTQSTKKRGPLLRWTLWYLLGSVGLLVAVSTSLIAFIPRTFEPQQLAFIFSTMLGHYGSLAGVLWLLAFLPLTLILPNKALVRGLIVIASAAAVLLLVIDVKVFTLYRFHLNGVILNLFLQDGGKEIFVLTPKEWVVVAATIAFILLAHAVLYLAVSRWVERAQARKIWGVLALTLLLGSFLASHLVHVWADAHYNKSITSLSRYVPLYRPATAKSLLHKHGLVDASQVREQTQHQELVKGPDTSQLLHYPEAALQCGVETADRTALNVLTVVVDSWRADELEPIASPYSYALSQSANSLTFNQHFSGGNSTQAGIFSLFYGLPSLYWQSMDDTSTAPVVLGSLQKAGYEMGIFGSAALTHPAFDRTVFSGVKNLRLTSVGDSPWERDESINAAWAEFMQTRNPNKPFFGFLFYDAVHGYSSPPSHKSPYQQVWNDIDRSKLDNDFDPVPYLNRHKTAVNYVDGLIAEVVEDLKQRGLYDSTVIIVTSDHGEEFNDNKLNYWGHGSNYTPAQLHVPFFMHWPGKQQQQFTHRSSHMDVAPTLLTELLACDNPPSQYSQGNNLLEGKSWPWMVASSYYNHAVLFEDTILVTYPTGNYELLTPDYREAEGPGAPAKLLSQVLSEMYKFLR